MTAKKVTLDPKGYISSRLPGEPKKCPEKALKAQTCGSPLYKHTNGARSRK